MSSIEDSIEKKLKALLDGKGEQDQEKRAQDLQALGLAIKWVAVKAKLDEADWGSDLKDDERKAG